MKNKKLESDNINPPHYRNGNKCFTSNEIDWYKIR